MKVIILAAGMGKRLHPITEHIPKAILKIGEKTLIEEWLDRLTKLSISEIVMVTGFKEEMIKELIGDSHNSIPITYVTNSEYETTNTIYSWWLTQEHVRDEEYLLVNGDVVHTLPVLEGITKNEYENAILIDNSERVLSSQDTKVATNNGRVVNIGKVVPEGEIAGEAIGVYKFSSEVSSLIFQEIEAVFKEDPKDGKTNHFQVPIKRILSKAEIYTYATEGHPWLEIDGAEDYNKAQETLKKIREKEN